MNRTAFSLAAAAGVALAVLPANAQQPADVAVTLANFAFSPEPVRVPVHRKVTLTLINSARGGHNFAARDFFRAAHVDPADAAKIRKGTVEVPGHASVSIALTIDQPGRYLLKCSHFLHASFGMTGAIVVE